MWDGYTTNEATCSLVVSVSKAKGMWAWPDFYCFVNVFLICMECFSPTNVLDAPEYRQYPWKLVFVFLDPCKKMLSGLFVVSGVRKQDVGNECLPQVFLELFLFGMESVVSLCLPTHVLGSCLCFLYTYLSECCVWRCRRKLVDSSTGHHHYVQWYRYMFCRCG